VSIIAQVVTALALLEITLPGYRPTELVLQLSHNDALTFFKTTPASSREQFTLLSVEKPAIDHDDRMK
jgi:hypothetical protein